MERNTVNLLFTGGWDSTFRFLQLAQYDIDVQPVYIIDKGRNGRKYELIAMEKIIKLARERFKANILDIKFYDRDEILQDYADEDISKAFRYLHETYHLGTQYEWFALLCKKLEMTMESAVVHQYHGKVEESIETEGEFRQLSDDILPDRWIAVSKQGDDKIDLIFGRLILPVIRLTKEDEMKMAEENGWLDIMKLTWFCHSPINGEPCGLCSPCDDAMNTGMQWRMPPMSQFRYRHKLFFRIIRKVCKVFSK